MAPKVSIIIPVYNVEEYLPKCLGSILNQSLKDIEIICVDDFSTDNSLNILREYKQKDNRIRIIRHSENRGPGITRNTGLNYAKGEYIMFLDSYDWLNPDSCDTAYNQIKKNNNDIVFFNHCVFYEYNNSIERKNPNANALEKVIDKPDIKLYEDVRGFYICSTNIWQQIYKKSFLEEYNIEFPDFRHAEDVPFFIKAIICADTVSFINKSLYNYRFRQDSLTRTRINEFEYLFSARELAQEYVNIYGKGTLAEAYLIYCIRSILYWYKHQNEGNIIPYYNRMHKYFDKLASENNVTEIKDYIKYKQFQEISDYNWKMKEFKNYINNNKYTKDIITIKDTTTHRILVFGKIKLKIRKRNRKHAKS